MSSPVIVWFRADLRLRDHDALTAAAATGRPVIPLFVHDEAPVGGLARGAASRWWLHHSLVALAAALESRGSRLVVARGDPARAIVEIARASKASAIHFHRQYGPGELGCAERVRASLRELGIEATEHPSTLLVEPGAISTRAGTPFRVFTPFHRAHESHPRGIPLPAPRTIAAPTSWPPSLPVESLGLLPRHDWTAGLHDAWTPGEFGAQRALEAFMSRGLSSYALERDHPAQPSTSRLSPHLCFGEVSPREVVTRAAAEPAGAAFVRQIVWREFAQHLLANAPSMLEHPLDARFERLEWRSADADVEAWRAGRTGYPIVDAGMRELWATGWMHNRVRMIAGSFLVKDLLVRWQVGAEWFWETLVDADAANNAMNWQWVAGCGADAAPFFRIFNPTVQGERFDARGEYIRRWIPELASLPDRVIHRPWDASPAELALDGIELGRTYPHRIVDHAAARLRALEAYRRITSKA